MNNRAWFYDLGRGLSDAPLPLGDREYIAAVKEMQLNTDFCAVRFDGQILLHAVDTTVSTPQEHEPKLFPGEHMNINGAQIICMSLTNDFLCFGSDVIIWNIYLWIDYLFFNLFQLGHLIHFSLEQWNTVIQHKHNVGLKKLYADVDGTRVIFVDDHNQGFVYLPVCLEKIIN